MHIVNLRVCKIKPVLSLFFDIVEAFTTPHLENVCQRNKLMGKLKGIILHPPQNKVEELKWILNDILGFL